MECKEVKAKLYFYSAGGLRRRLRAEIARHLPLCPECMKEFKVIEMAIGILEKLPQEEPAAGMWNGVFSKIREKERKSRLEKGIGLSRIFGILEWVRLRPVSVISAFALFIVFLIGGIYFFEEYYYQAPKKDEQNYITEYIAFSLQDPLADKIALGRMMAREPMGEEIK